MQFALVLQTVLTVVNGAARKAVETVADVAEEGVDVVVEGTPSDAVRRGAVVAVSVLALRFTRTQLQVLLVNVFGYELITYR